MSNCTTIRKRKRRVCLGDLVDVITLHNREIETPAFNTVDFDETFTPINLAQPTRLSMINTVTGKTYFDGVNTEYAVTHEIYIVYDPQVTSATWLEFEGRRIDILNVEDFEERHEFMLLTCNERGRATQEATKR